MSQTVLYHGTTPAVAKILLQGGILITQGGGEFGVGFYMGTSKRLAKRRAFHKTYSQKGTAKAAMCLNNNTLSITLDKNIFRHSYICRQLDLRASIGLYGYVKKCSTFMSFNDGSDAIEGHIVGWSRYFDVTQYKFQSSKAQLMLNVGCPYNSFSGKKII